MTTRRTAVCAAATRRAYLRAVERLAKHYGCSPEYLSAEQVQAYIAYLHIERGMAWGTCGVADAGRVDLRCLENPERTDGRLTRPG